MNYKKQNPTPRYILDVEALRRLCYFLVEAEDQFIVEENGGVYALTEGALREDGSFDASKALLLAKLED